MVPSPSISLSLQALSHIIAMMQDPSAVVKDSVAWLLSRIIDLQPDVALATAFFVPLVQALMAGLRMESRVSANCCWVRWVCLVEEDVCFGVSLFLFLSL